MWKGVSLVWESVPDSLVWSVGGGRSVDFWRDAWLKDVGPLIDLILEPIGAMSLLRVSMVDMVDAMGSWKWWDFDSLLPISVLHRLAATMFPN
ncbi:hypothetical protein V6N13_125885 [Hibiscus sabdariffa]